MKRTRRKHTAIFKAKVAIEALKERESLAELSAKYEISQSQISKWKQAFLDGSSSVFEKDTKDSEVEDVDSERLYAKIGKLELENEYLKKNLKKLGL
jgi:transposase-like protein